MGVSWETVYENGLIDESIMECIPQECECGGKIEFTESLRQIYCSNPQCYYKAAARLEAMAKAMKVDGWGESTCVEVCRELHMVSPYQAFILDKAVANGYTRYLSVPALEKKISALLNSPKRKAELWEVVKYAGIPNIESTAYKIFNGYNSLSEAFEDIERGQVPFIAEKLGIKSSESSAMAVNIYTNLIEYKDELLFGETQFDIYRPEGETLYITITGGVQGFKNKGEFVNYINNRYAGKINAMLMNTVSKQIDILVADGDTNSNKFRTACSINSQYIEKCVNSGEFTLDDVGKYESDKDLHPIGEKILITNSRKLLEDLDRVYGKED